jgi:hypothetical protein
MAKTPEAGPDLNDVTVMFHVTEDEMAKAEALISRALANELENEKDGAKLYTAILAALDQVVPAAKLTEKAAQGEVIGLAVLRKGQALPDSRFRRRPAQPPSPAQNAQPSPATAGGEPIMAAAIDPKTAMGAKLNGVLMTELPAERVAELKIFSEQQGIPYPTHQGTVSLDGKTELKVYQLSNGQRVVDAVDLHRFFTQFGGI